MKLNYIKSKYAKSRVINNAISFSGLNLATALTQFFFPPLMILLYGLENFGIWIFLSSIPGIFNLLNFNFNTAATTEMSIFFNKRKIKKINQIFNNSILLILVTILILFITSFIIIENFDFNIKILSNINNEILYKILICIFGSLILSCFNDIFKTSLSYQGKYYISNYIDISFDILSKVLIIIFGFFSNNLLNAAYGLLISRSISTFAFFLCYVKFNKYLKIDLIYSVDKRVIINLIKLSIPYYFQTCSGILKHSIQIFILGSFFGANLVGMVSTLKTLFYFFPLKFWSIVSRTIFYEFTKLFAEKKFLKLKKLFYFFLKLCLFYLTIYFSFSFFAGDHVYRLWLDNNYDLDTMLFILIILDLVFFIFSGSIIHLNKSINNFLPFTSTEIILNLLILFFCYYLFLNNYSYNYIFIFNLLASIALTIFGYFNIKLLFKNNFKIRQKT